MTGSCGFPEIGVHFNSYHGRKQCWGIKFNQNVPTALVKIYIHLKNNSYDKKFMIQQLLSSSYLIVLF